MVTFLKWGNLNAICSQQMWPPQGTAVKRSSNQTCSGDYFLHVTELAIISYFLSSFNYMSHELNINAPVFKSCTRNWNPLSKTAVNNMALNNKPLIVFVFYCKSIWPLVFCYFPHVCHVLHNNCLIKRYF